MMRTTDLIKFLLGVIAVLSMGYLLIRLGVLEMVWLQESPMASLLNQLQENLGTSAAFFGPVFLLYIYYLMRLKHQLSKNELIPQELIVVGIDGRLDMLTSLFFGIGVIWTAIGMRDALISSLGDLDAQSASAKGAWYILSRLVDGGLLQALSTTIFGGMGGFFMRLLKRWVVDDDIDQFYTRQHETQERLVLDKLDELIQTVKEIHIVQDPIEAQEATSTSPSLEFTKK
jgi:hypothetical protein